MRLLAVVGVGVPPVPRRRRLSPALAEQVVRELVVGELVMGELKPTLAGDNSSQATLATTTTAALVTRIPSAVAETAMSHWFAKLLPFVQSTSGNSPSCAFR